MKMKFIPNKSAWLMSLILINVIGCRNSGVAPVIITPTPIPIELTDFKLGPIQQFEKACARCHGPYGSFYAESFTQLDEEKLQTTVREMMEGPGQLSPTESEVKAMIQYHRSLRKQSIFLIVTNAAAIADGTAKSIQGEVTLGASVEIRKDNSTKTVTVNGTNWILDQPLQPPFTLIARRGDQSVSLAFPSSQWNLIP